MSYVLECLTLRPTKAPAIATTAAAATTAIRPKRPARDAAESVEVTSDTAAAACRPLPSLLSPALEKLLPPLPLPPRRPPLP